MPKGEGEGSIYRQVGWPDDENTPDDHRYPSRASGDRVRDRRRSIRTPIPTKLRPTRSARRALRPYLTAVTFRQHFSGAHKIIRLLNKRGFRSGGDGWSCAGCDGARVKSRCRKVECPGGKGSVSVRYENMRGKIFTDYYFGEANTANKSGNHHSNAINENLNWGGISGLLQKGRKPMILKWLLLRLVKAFLLPRMSWRRL